MQELEEFLEKQRDLNVKMIQDLLSTQSLLQHNLQMGLISLKKSVQTLPIRKFNACSQSRVSLMRKNQHNHILSKFDSGVYHFQLTDQINCIYRERMFTLSLIVLEDFVGEWKSQAQLKLFTSEKFPQEITRNIQGKPIFKGQTQIPMKRQLLFNKLQITEVSSHFPSGKFIIVVIADNFHPLIIDNIIVKAKKMDKK